MYNEHLVQQIPGCETEMRKTEEEVNDVHDGGRILRRVLRDRHDRPRIRHRRSAVAARDQTSISLSNNIVSQHYSSACFAAKQRHHYVLRDKKKVIAHQIHHRVSQYN